MIKSNQQKANDMLYIIQKSINQLIHMLQGADEEETKELTDELNQHVIIRSALLDILNEERREVTEVKRLCVKQVRDFNGEFFVDFAESPEGDFVLWKDVEHLIHPVVKKSSTPATEGTNEQD